MNGSGEERPAAQDDVVAAAAAEQRPMPASEVEAADLADKYDRMLRLAAVFDQSGEEMRERATLGGDVLDDPPFADSAPLSPATHAQAEADIRAATTGRNGLLTRSIELDADALVLRATVLTYRWIDDLQEAAYRTLGSIAGRAIGYLAPEVALGGAIVSAGLIETDALDRDGVAAYLSELAESNPDLMEHVTSGGGGLLDGLQMRSVLTAGVLAGDTGAPAARGGLRAAGVHEMEAGFAAALRDVGGGLVQEGASSTASAAAAAGRAPSSLAELMQTLEGASEPLTVVPVSESRFIAYVAGPVPGPGRVHLVSGDRADVATQTARALEAAVHDDARVMLVGAGHGGSIAAELAAATGTGGFTVERVITAGAPSAHVPRVPEPTRVLSLEDRADPVALLGSLINAGEGNRLTVVFDGADADGESIYVAGGRAADAADHPELQAEIAQLRELGYLAG